MSSAIGWVVCLGVAAAFSPRSASPSGSVSSRWSSLQQQQQRRSGLPTALFAVKKKTSTRKRKPAAPPPTTSAESSGGDDVVEETPATPVTSQSTTILRPPTQAELRQRKYGALDTAQFPTPVAPTVAPKAGPKVAAGDGLRLPNLQELSEASKKREDEKPDKPFQIPRGDLEMLRRAIEADPNADMNPDLYAEATTAKGRVDIVSNVLGDKADKFLAIDTAYIQLGHTVLAGVILLFAVARDPGLPLTDLPQAYRDFFLQGLAVIYGINVGVAFLAYGEAQKREQPTVFWAAKSFLLGGIALYQLRTSTGTDTKSSKAIKRKRSTPYPERYNPNND